MSQEVEMKVDPSRAAALISQLGSVSERIAAVAKGRNVKSPVSSGRHEAFTNSYNDGCRLFMTDYAD